MLKRLKGLRIGREAFLVIFAVVVSLLSISISMPSTTPYSVFNTDDRGYSYLALITDAKVSIDIPVDVGVGSVIFMPLTSHLDSSKYVVLESLLKKGSTVVLLDEEGYSNGFLRYIDVDAEIMNTKVLDEVYRVFSREYPLASLEIGNASLALAMYRPSYIVLRGAEKAKAIATTSRYSYSDTNGDGFYTSGEVMERHVVGCLWVLGNGSLWLLADLDIFANKLIGFGQNKNFLEFIAGKRDVYIVIGYAGANTIDRLKYVLTRLLPRTAVQDYYVDRALLIYIVVVVMCVVMVMHRGVQR